jgi:hypothetical protein
VFLILLMQGAHMKIFVIIFDVFSTCRVIKMNYYFIFNIFMDDSREGGTHLE